MEAKKRCACCNRLRPLSAFNKKSSSPDGLQPYCKKCQHEWRMADKAEKAARAAKEMEEAVAEQAQPAQEVVIEPDNSKTYKHGDVLAQVGDVQMVVFDEPNLEFATTENLIKELSLRGLKGSVFNPQTNRYINL